LRHRRSTLDAAQTGALEDLGVRAGT